MATDTKILENTRRWRLTYKGLTANLYGKINERKRRGTKDHDEFNLESFRTWLESTPIKRIYEKWKASGFKRELRPSVDRINPLLGYKLTNMQVITAQENRRKGDKEKEILWGKAVVAIKDRKAWCFDSIKSASERTGINRNNISSACNGKRKTAGGYKWEFSPDGLRGKEFSAVIFDEVIGNIHQNPELL